MATQLAEAFEPDTAPPEGANDQGDGSGFTERDYDAEARQHGWTPKEEFRGDPARWVDAETFVKRADEVMPLLKKKADAQAKEIAGLKRDIRQASAHFEKAEQRAYERAIADIEKRMEAAAEVGDVAGVKAASKEMRELSSEAKSDAPGDNLELRAQEAEIEWREKNPWFDKGGIMADYAVVQSRKFAHLAKDMDPAAYYDMITEKVREKFGDKLDQAVEPAPRKAAVAVEGVGTNRGNGRQKGWADMDPEARRTGQAMADRWVKSGLLKTRDDFLKTYDFGDKK